MHHDRCFQFICMVTGIIEISSGGKHLVPFTCGDYHVWIVNCKVTYHAFEIIAAMAVDNQEPSETLMVKRRHYVCQHSHLGGLARVHTELKLLCPGFCAPNATGGITMARTP